jgi:hypothetical protein
MEECTALSRGYMLPFHYRIGWNLFGKQVTNSPASIYLEDAVIGFNGKVFLVGFTSFSSLYK